MIEEKIRQLLEVCDSWFGVRIKIIQKTKKNKGKRH